MKQPYCSPPYRFCAVSFFVSKLNTFQSDYWYLTEFLRPLLTWGGEGGGCITVLSLRWAKNKNTIFDWTNLKWFWVAVTVVDTDNTNCSNFPMVSLIDDKYHVISAYRYNMPLMIMNDTIFTLPRMNLWKIKKAFKAFSRHQQWWLTK